MQISKKIPFFFGAVVLTAACYGFGVPSASAYRLSQQLEHPYHLAGRDGIHVFYVSGLSGPLGAVALYGVATTTDKCRELYVEEVGGSWWTSQNGCFGSLDGWTTFDFSSIPSDFDPAKTYYFSIDLSSASFSLGSASSTINSQSGVSGYAYMIATSPYDIPSATTTEEYPLMTQLDCGTFDAGCQVKNAVIWLLYPSAQTIEDAKAALAIASTTFPMSYVFDITTMANELLTQTSTSTLTVGATTSLGYITFISPTLIANNNYIVALVRESLKVLIYFFGAMTMYRMAWRFLRPI